MAVRLRMCSHLLRNVLFSEGGSLGGLSQRYPWRLMSATATNSDTSAPEDGAKVAAEPSDASEDPLAKAEEAFKADRDKLQKTIDELQDKYRRSLAETENVRQRMKNQVDDAKLFAIQGFCKDLIDVSDILGKATESVPQEELTGSNPHLKNLYEGLVMTQDQLQKVYTRNGLNQIKPVEGDKFDPNIHEALFQAPLSDGKQPGTIAVITKLGYTLHSRTLRPALVGVFKDD